MPRLRIQHQNNLAAMGRDYSLRIPKDGDLGMEHVSKIWDYSIFVGNIGILVAHVKYRTTLFYSLDITVVHVYNYRIL